MSSAIVTHVVRVQDRWSTLLGCPPGRRASVISQMMKTDPSEAAGYWLQLALSVGIATMGLVLDSSAVVIGAMLVAPLLGPIEVLGMGLAVGSPLLVLRSGARVLLSVLVAIVGSAVIVRALPFQNMTAEIAARTLPTALDLATAAFCALAGVYAAIRPTSDVASTAAGTSIGISLVPPLCASGYGLGVVDTKTAAGAALLFVTNLVAIIVVAALSFAVIGFHRAPIAALEREALDQQEPTTLIPRLAGRVARRFSARGGLGLRLMMPLLLLAIVFFPLRAALDEVAWQVRVRNRVTSAIAALDQEVLESSVRIDRDLVDVALVLIGTVAEAADVRAALEQELQPAAETVLRVAVYAVPDATAFAGLADELRKLPPPAAATVVEPLPPPPAPRASERLDDALGLVESSVLRLWPAAISGEVLAIELRRLPDAYGVAVTHHGPPLDPAARELLAAALATELEREIVLDDRAIASEPLVPSRGLTAFAIELGVAIDRARTFDRLWLCVDVPSPPPARRRRPTPTDPGRELVLEVLKLHPRVRTTEGDEWRAQLVADGCETPADAETVQ